MNVSIDISEIKALEGFFDGLSKLDQRRIIMSAYRKAVRPLIETSKALAPKGDQLGIYRSMGSIEFAENMAIIVGSLTNTKRITNYRGKNYISKVWYAHLFEEGTKQRFRKSKTGTGATGKIAATHFFENAYNQTENRIFETVENEWYASIASYINRTNKRKR